MPDSTSSANSPSSKGGSRRHELAIVTAAVLLLSAAAISWTFVHGYTLDYGDAEAHLNIARRILDNREPAYRELGTVWLPLPHLLILPLVGSDVLWRTGLAGAIPAGICFAITCLFFFASLRLHDGLAASAAGVAVFALNPNVLYLQSIPMTESLFFACLAGLLYFTLRERPALAGLCTLLATLTRYEGWFLIPAVFLRLLRERGFRAGLAFGSIASVGPLYWLAHNWYLFGSALYFYEGPWSAKAIYQRQLDAGMQPHPADGHWFEALRYYFEASRLTAGDAAMLLGLLGLARLLYRKPLWPALLLALPALFYVWSLRSSGTPIFIPGLWPDSYYNTRYALALLPLLAWGAAALVRGSKTAVLAVAMCTLPWLAKPLPDAVACWKESQVNSAARRAWSVQAAAFLSGHYRNGDGILYDFGDLTAILRHAGIPLRETLHDGNELTFIRALARPDLFLKEEWILTFRGSELSRLAAKSSYEKAAEFANSGGQPVEIYRRALPVREGARPTPPARVNN